MNDLWGYLETNGGDILTALVQHIWLALLPVAIDRKSVV